MTITRPYIAFAFLEQLFLLINNRNVDSRTVIEKTASVLKFYSKIFLTYIKKVVMGVPKSQLSTIFWPNIS